MSDYTITVPSRTQNIRHPKLRALKGVQIGPIFHDDPDRELGMRHLDQPKGRAVDWMKYREKRRKRNLIASHSRIRNRSNA